MIIALVTIIVILLVVMAAFLFLSAPRRESERPGMEKLHVDYAHRGIYDNKDIPENSIAAFEAAMAAGFGIELDVHLSSDGDVVVFHDDDLLRMCGEETKISELRGAELSWRRLAGTEHTLPLMTDVLNAVKGRVPILIELKGVSFDTSLCENLARVMQYYDGKYCVQSFNPFLLGWFKKHAPRVPRGLLYMNYIKEKKWSFVKAFALTLMLPNVVARPDFIACDQRCVDSFPVKLMRNFYKLPIFVWTITDNDSFARNRSAKIKNIFEGFIPEGSKE